MRTGRQEPTTAFILPYSDSVGADAIDLYELSGKPAEPWQELLAYDLLAVGDDGKWIHTVERPAKNGASFNYARQMIMEPRNQQETKACKGERQDDEF